MPINSKNHWPALQSYYPDNLNRYFFTFDNELLVANIWKIIHQRKLQATQYMFNIVLCQKLLVVSKWIVSYPHSIFVDENRLLLMKLSFFGEHPPHFENEVIHFLFIFGMIYYLSDLLLYNTWFF